MTFRIPRWQRTLQEPKRRDIRSRCTIQMTTSNVEATSDNVIINQ
jgi:hypothetical protein